MKKRICLDRLLLDIDRDGVPDWRDCNPFDARYQHSQKWKKEVLKKELFKREHAEDLVWHLNRGWTEEQAVSRMQKKPTSNLEKLISRHMRIASNPSAVAFVASDIRRTKDVVEYLKQNNLKDFGSEIKL